MKAQPPGNPAKATWLRSEVAESGEGTAGAGQCSGLRWAQNGVWARVSSAMPPRAPPRVLARALPCSCVRRPWCGGVRGGAETAEAPPRRGWGRDAAGPDEGRLRVAGPHAPATTDSHTRRGLTGAWARWERGAGQGLRRRGLAASAARTGGYLLRLRPGVLCRRSWPGREETNGACLRCARR